MSGWREKAAWTVALVTCVPVLLGSLLLLPIALVTEFFLGDRAQSMP
nr:MAG TPA: hypothetical protein [Caudoviricetes sp.]